MKETLILAAIPVLFRRRRHSICCRHQNRVTATNRKTPDDLKARLDALNREYRDGLLSDQPLSGALE